MAKTKTNTGLPKDHTGIKFGRLLAIKRISRKMSGTYTAYECLCDCGNTITVRSCGLVSGNTKSCGCLNIEQLRNNKKDTVSIGVRFSRLVTQKRIMKPKRGVVWECLCDCGKTIFIKTASLKNGNTKSCGCFNLEEIIKRNHDPKLILKRMKSASDAIISLHWKTQEELICKGGWEASVVDWLNDNKVNYDWQVSFKLSDSRTYIIDFYDKDRNTYIEIKGWWRDDAFEKFSQFKKDYPLLKVEIWDKQVLLQKNIPLRTKNGIEALC